MGLGATYTPTGTEGEPGGRLKIAGLAVEKALEIFQKAAYGQTF